ncbi:GntR family transcriptional regulator [Acetobacter sp. TBRC 12305]|uniref:GntR family transcriptional regulator n=1 Tax=Acetobacter garciniae TaxID=2817435 RepID=A0A939KPU3_9PROT|nr:GntR family transcriptional regulator [Acetobacter garciniae]MBO1324444.1 GntR family transcriptional regulator [Acetobacter garciniae]MBX0344133.1 GntR family transcriptional regulator [Acetobacter garciniae]
MNFPKLSDQAAPESLALVAYNRLRALLLAGELAPGSLIQERKLAEWQGLSRTPVRDALNRLETERLLTRKDRLLFVTTISVREIIDILNARRLLESEAARAAVSRMSAAEIASIRAAILEMGKAGEVSDNLHWQVDDMVHFGIADAAGNSEIRRMIGELRQRTRMFGMRRIPSRFENGMNEHLAILDAIEAQDAALAAERMAHHIDRARQAIVAMLQETQDHAI